MIGGLSLTAKTRVQSQTNSHRACRVQSVTATRFCMSSSVPPRQCISNQYHTLIFIPLSSMVWAGIAHSLRAGRSGDRIPVGLRFSALVQKSPGAYPASCTMGTGYFPGVKWPRCGVDHPPSSSVELRKEWSYKSTPPLGLRGLL